MVTMCPRLGQLRREHSAWRDAARSGTGIAAEAGARVARRRQKRRGGSAPRTSAGDSGGSVFLGDTVVALSIWVGGMCGNGPAYEYRLDTALAHDFLDKYLP
jgi:hypothetical protein